MEELRQDPIIVARLIEVETLEGVVTLTGRQPVLLARDRATYAAEVVRGVREVVNKIEIWPKRDVDSERLEADIMHVLLADPATERHEFSVAADDQGRVVLSGVVESRAERYLAEQAVKSVKGVSALDNRIEIIRSAMRPDQELREEIRRMLQWDAYVNADAIQIEVDDGIVTLSGMVSSAAEKRRAVGLSWVAGVRHVNVTPLNVVPLLSEELPRSRARGAPLELKSDAAIAAAVRRAFRADPRLSDSYIVVSVEDGVVMLDGTVTTLRAWRLAQRTPYALRGVVSVQNRIRVDEGLESYSDDEILQQLQRLLTSNSVTSTDEIRVEVRDGAVTLEGHAANWLSRRTAERLAATVRGVTDVINEIEVNSRATRVESRADVVFESRSRRVQIRVLTV